MTEKDSMPGEEGPGVACVDCHSVTLRGLSIRAGPAAVGQSVAGGVEAGTRGLDFFI